MLSPHPYSYFLPYSHSFDKFFPVRSVSKRYPSGKQNAERVPGGLQFGSVQELEGVRSDNS